MDQQSQPPQSRPNPLAGAGREARLAARRAEPPKVQGARDDVWALAMWRLAVDEFNSRQFFACHETLEELWKEDASPARQVYQGILQVGVAFHHVRVTRRWRGAVRMLMSGTDFLAPYLAKPDDWPQPLRSVPPDLARLHADALRALAHLQALNPTADYAALAARQGRSIADVPPDMPPNLVPHIHIG